MGFGIFDGQMGYRDLDVLVALKAGTTDTAEVLKSSHNALNHNRTSAKTTDATITHTPTVTAVGTQMNGTEFLAAGNKGDGAGAVGSAFGNEFNLAPSTSYLFRLTNVSGGASQTSTGISFYHPLL